MFNTALSITEYFFSFSPPPEFSLQWIPWVLCGIAVITAIISYIKIKTCKEKILRKILQEYPGKFVTISLLLGINILARLNRIDVVSMRIFTYILFIWLLFAFYRLYRDLRTTYPQRINQQSLRLQRLEKKYHIHKNKSNKKNKKRR
jgi:hypothetical protein